MIKICKKRTDPFSQYSCKIATVDELETKWDAQIKRQKSPNWKIWKREAVERVSAYGSMPSILCLVSTKI